VTAPFFPITKDEGWWLVVGEQENRQLAAIKRFTFQHQYQYRLNFVAPDSPGEYLYKLFLMSDSWVGCDQEYEFKLFVTSAMQED
jgi:pre-mRNA-splicing helicase BRR2